jgi:G3E family GTPase
MPATRLILVGGFLGAGKTTLLAQATARLTRRGKRVGLITNDQAADLVDTAILEESAWPVQEVSGGCFCCRFDDLVAAMERLLESGAPEVLLGEPVGSCTDLSATVLQPLKEHYRERFHVAPFSVLVDVHQVRTLQRLRQSLRSSEPPRFPENVMYIYQKQLEEADLIVLNKADLLPADELADVQRALRHNFSQAPVIAISALDGSGVDAWLDYVLGTNPAGRTITEVDYDQYAEGEAALGWLNASIRLDGRPNTDWRAFCSVFLDAMRQHCRESSAEIAHLKLHLEADHSSLTANLTGNHEEPSVRGRIDGSPTTATLLLNVRANIDPSHLRLLTEQCLQHSAGTAIRRTIEHIQSFAPSRPQPTHRYRSVV